ncbi:hypothetical protein ACCT30_41945, partial [Rhizobium ruizarguesonis]
IIFPVGGRVALNAMLIQQAALVRCIKQSAPLWEGWYRTALSRVCLEFHISCSKAAPRIDGGGAAGLKAAP